MQKLTKFKDIPKFTSAGSYEVDYQLNRLVRFIEDEVAEYDLQLNPDFQRGHVWTEAQQIAWLEYHFKGGKSGNTIYLNYPFWGSNRTPKPDEYQDYVCVDGLQRITAAQRFINNEIKIFGSYYKEFKDKIRMINVTMHVNVNNLQSKKEVLQWYIDMNSGGTPHSTEEMNRVKELLQKS